MSERLQRWTRWIDGTIRGNVLRMHLQRDSYMKVSRMLSSNEKLPESYWWEFMTDTYITTAAMAVRRQADNDRRVASLARIMIEMKSNPQQITRDYWIGQWRGDEDTDHPFLRLEAERGWDTQYAGSIGDHLDPAIPTADYKQLTSAASKVNDFVNRHIAHSQSMIRQPDLKQGARRRRGHGRRHDA